MKPLNIVQNNYGQFNPISSNTHKGTTVKKTQVYHMLSPSVYRRGDENFDVTGSKNESVYDSPFLLTKPVKARSAMEIRRPRERLKQLPPSIEVGMTDVPLHDETSLMDLSVLSKTYDRRGVDFPPFFRTYDYEARYDTDDVVKLTIENDTAYRKKPVRFGKEMEYRELKKSVKILDYISYYMLGIDKSGFFELAKERRSFLNFPMCHYTAALEQRDQTLGDFDELFEENDFEFDSTRESDEQDFEI